VCGYRGRGAGESLASECETIHVSGSSVWVTTANPALAHQLRLDAETLIARDAPLKMDAFVHGDSEWRRDLMVWLATAWVQLVARFRNRNRARGLFIEFASFESAAASILGSRPTDKDADRLEDAVTAVADPGQGDQGLPVVVAAVAA
jgi:hypothetical protein